MKYCLLLLLTIIVIDGRAENITFADNGIKTLCVMNWDTNQDGELSNEEAAAVTSLGQIFHGRTDIGSFNELKYFTGLTTIDEYAFSESSVGPEITIPGSVKTISNHAFHKCNMLQRIIMEEGVERVEYNAFYAPVAFWSIPASVTFLGDQVINPNFTSGSVISSDGDLYVKIGSLVPPTIGTYVFYNVFGEGHLIVPMGCIEAYKSVAAWSHFGEYIEAGDVNRDGVLDQTDVTLMEEMVNGNEDENVIKDIADINGDGVVNETDINLLKEYLGSTTAITETETATGTEDGATYNLAGQRVDSSYRGLVIRNGRKYVQR